MHSKHEESKQEFLRIADEWASLAREIDQIKQMRKFTEAAGRSARNIHID
jgi:hypothetical protein